MNSTVIENTVETPVASSPEAPVCKLSELQVVELAYVGGGMANVSFV